MTPSLSDVSLKAKKATKHHKKLQILYLGLFLNKSHYKKIRFLTSFDTPEFC